MDRNSRIFIIEDNKQISNRIKQYISEYLIARKLDIEILTINEKFQNVVQLINPNTNSVNIYFLDILLNDSLNGLHLAQKIRSKDIFGYIIFITSHLEFAYPAIQYRVRALDYILKSDEELKQKIFKCLDIIQNEHTGINKNIDDKTFLVRTNGTDFLIPVKEIIFFETNTAKRNIILHTTDKTIEFRSTLDEIQNSLDDSFYRCHRSYLINLKHIRSISRNRSDMHVLLSHDYKCPVAPRFLKRLVNYEKNL